MYKLQWELSLLLKLIYAFFPAVYSTAVIPISIFVRLELVAMFVTEKQLWENQEFIDPGCDIKIPMLFLPQSNPILKTMGDRSTGSRQKSHNLNLRENYPQPPDLPQPSYKTHTPCTVGRRHWNPIFKVGWRNSITRKKVCPSDNASL